MPTAIERRLRKSEKDAARKRAQAEFELHKAAVESISEDELAWWWYGAQQDLDRAVVGDYSAFEEPARSGVRAWWESGAVTTLKAASAEYDDGPLPMKEVPDSSKFISLERTERVREKTAALARKHGQPVQKASWHPAHPDNPC